MSTNRLGPEEENRKKVSVEEINDMRTIRTSDEQVDILFSLASMRARILVELRKVCPSDYKESAESCFYNLAHHEVLSRKVPDNLMKFYLGLIARITEWILEKGDMPKKTDIMFRVDPNEKNNLAK